MKRAKKWIADGLILALSVGLTLYYVFRGQDLEQMLMLLRQARPLWCGLGLCCMVLFMLGETVVFRYLFRVLGQKTRWSHCCLYAFTGFFYAAITPGAGGGQPMQAYYMKQDDIPVAVSIPVLTMVTILYKAVLIVISTAVLLLRPAAIMKALAPCMTWCWLGLGLNVAFVGALLLFIGWPQLARRIGCACVRFAETRLRIRRAAALYPAVEQGCRKYAGVVERFRKEGKAIAAAFLMTMLQRTLLFAVTWMSCRAFGQRSCGLLQVMILQAMIHSAADMMPLPGGTGISEHLFLEIFAPLLGQTLDLPVMVLSRGLSFYSRVLVSGVFAMAAMVVFRRQRALLQKQPPETGAQGKGAC